MNNVMHKYETIFIINPNLSEEENNGLVEKFKTLIASAGEIENVDEWGKRRLAYEIDDIKEGYYVLIDFSADPSSITELERIYKITDGILRHIVVRKDK